MERKCPGERPFQSGESAPKGMTTYFALIRRKSPRVFVATFPDFPGCSVQARSFKRVQELAIEEVSRHLERIHAHEAEPPKPTPLSALQNDPENVDAVAYRVLVPG